MYETLKALSIRLDAPAQTLTKDAIAQLLIKIVYNSENSMSKNEVVDKYKEFVGCDDAKKESIISILESLKDKELQYRNGRYYLSTAKREQINKVREASEIRFKYVIETYCRPFFSNEDNVKTWLQDALIIFFSYYSKEWIADLCYKQNTVAQTIDQVIEQIARKTAHNKSICKEDKESLLDSFKRILTNSDTDHELGLLLWEYGSSQFASQLIKNGNNIDKLTVETFSDAICLLDTNILMHLALYRRDISKRLSSIEKIFQSLGISVKYLFITKEEYQNTVSSKSHQILKLFDSYEPDVISQTDNEFIQAALKFGFKGKDGFERFFNQIQKVPTVIDKTVMVSLLDDSSELNSVIEKAQVSEDKRSELNSIFRSLSNKDKKDHALIHDVGLIAGVNHLRQNGKFFILTQDGSIINYAKKYPFTNGLPIAIKIDTLLNVLAVNSFRNGEEDYIPLFASIIRQGLQPNSHTFRVEDLFYILEKEQFVSRLPSNSVIEIVNDVSRRRLLGESDEEISKELTRKVQSEKFKVVQDLDKTKALLSNSESQRQKALDESNRYREQLIEKYRTEKSKDVSNKIRNIWLKGIGVLIAVILLSLLAVHFLMPNDSQNKWVSLISALIIDIIISGFYWITKSIPNIIKLKRNKDKLIEEYINEKINK